MNKYIASFLSCSVVVEPLTRTRNKFQFLFPVEWGAAWEGKQSHCPLSVVSSVSIWISKLCDLQRVSLSVFIDIWVYLYIYKYLNFRNDKKLCEIKIESQTVFCSVCSPVSPDLNQVFMFVHLFSMCCSSYMCTIFTKHRTLLPSKDFCQFSSLKRNHSPELDHDGP